MLSSRPSLRLRRIDRDRLAAETRPGSRLLYLFFFVILLTSMVMSLDPSADFTGGRLAGTVVFFVLLLGSLAFALYSRRLIIDRSRGSAELRKGVLIFPLSAKSYSAAEIRRIVLKRAVLLRGRKTDGETSGGGSRGGASAAPKTLQWLFSPGSSRHELATLSMELPDESVKLDSSTEPLSLRHVGEELAGFLGVPYAEAEE